ncbi:MAG: hypothetical protein ACQESR_18525 [Planctomycetota bacterium]
MNVDRTTRFVGVWFAVALALLALPGCGKPQAAPRNRALISSLRTAVNTQNAEWLEKNATIVEKRHAAGKMSDEEYGEFQSIIAAAREGQWEKAEQQTIAFQKAQRPTREEMERARHFSD